MNFGGDAWHSDCRSILNCRGCSYSFYNANTSGNQSYHNLSQGYSPSKCSSLSSMQRQQIYQERDHHNKVQTVAAIICEYDEETIINKK
jgi:hypothetical protein